MENSEIPGRIQMERFTPVEIFRKKSKTFRGVTVFRFLPKRPKLSVLFVWITRLHVERKRKIDRYFVNGTSQSRSCFRCQKNTSTIWQKFFTEISVQMVSAPGVWGLNSRSPARRTGAHPTELRIQCPFLSQRLNFSERHFYQQKTTLVPRSRRLRRQGIWVRDHEKKGMS